MCCACMVALWFLLSASPFLAQQPGNAQQAAEDYRQGVAAFSRNDLQTALRHFQNVVRISPEAEPGHLMLGFVLAKLGLPKEAIPELEKAVTLNPDDTDAHMNLALAYEQIGAPAKAIPHFAKLDEAARAQGHGLPPQALVAYIRALEATKQWNEATAKMLAAAAAEPQNAELRDQCGSLYLQQHDW